MNMKKIFVTDLDGTLLCEDKEISPNTRKAIESLREQGHIFAIATGRPFPSSLSSIPDLESLFDFGIFNNGANVYDFKDKEIHDQFPLSNETITDIITTYRPLGANPILFTGEIMYCDKEDEYTEKVSSFLNVQYVNVLNHLENTHEKIIFSAFGETMDAIERYSIENTNPNYRSFKSQSELIEFMDPRVNKWYGIEYYLNKYNLDKKNVITFGDNDNDVEMVEHAHLGYAMENATPAVKAVTAHIAPSNENEGVYQIIKTYLD